MPWFAQEIAKGTAIHVPCVADLPREADLERKHFEEQGIQSLLVIPMKTAGRLAGFLGFDSVRKARIWTEDDRLLLQFMADTVAGALLRIQQEALLTESEVRYRHIFDLSPVGIVILDPEDARPVVFNEAAHRQLGYSREEFALLTLADIDAEETPEETTRHIERVMRGERSEFETRHRAKSGEIRDVRVTAQYLRMGDGGIYHCLWEDITDRKRAVEELRENEARYRLLIENLPQKISLKDKNSVYVSCNDNYARDLGIRAKEIGQKTDFDFHPQELAEKYRLDDRRILATGEMESIEERYLQGGRESFVHTVKTPIMDEQGNSSGILGIFWDITERKQDELERNCALELLELLNARTGLRETMQSLLQFMQRMSDCDAVGIRLRDGDDFPYYETSGFPGDFVEAERRLCVRSLDGQLLRNEVGNPELECMCGNIICGRFDPSLPFFTEFGSFISNGTSKLLATTTDEDRQARTRNRCNAEGYESVMLVPLRCGGETFGLLQFNDRREDCFPDRFVALIERLAGDVALALAQRRSDEALRESEERHRAILSTAMDGFWIVDDAGRFLEVNETYCEMSGYSEHELLCMDISAVEDVESASDTAAHMQRVITEGQDRFESRHRRKDGSAFDVEVSVQYRPSDERTCVVFIRDITDRKAAQAEQEKLQSQLTQARKMEAVGQLAGGVAHDFNNLLQVILGYGEMAMQQAAADSQAGASVQEVVRAAERAETLVSQLLAFSRQQVLDLRDMDLNESISDMLKILRRTIGEHIDLNFHAGHQLANVHADPGQMGQIVMNLCVNARDAMPTGGTLTIETGNVRIDQAYCETHAHARPGCFVQLGVADTGCGMDVETREKIFEPFFTTKEFGQGTGLGLATVYGLVKQHDGFVDVQSEIGKGSVFRVYVPVAEGSGQAVDHRVEGQSPGGTETILLAEDDEMVRRLTRAILETAGYTVLPAGDGEEALAVFEAHSEKIGLLLLDVVMPKLGGRATYERIREKCPGVRALFASGYNRSAIHTGFVLDEGLHLIQKPAKRDALLSKVREVLDAGREKPLPGTKGTPGNPAG